MTHRSAIAAARAHVEGDIDALGLYAGQGLDSFVALWMSEPRN
jgi:hypothetical protein